MTPAESGAKGKPRAELDAWQAEQAAHDAGLGIATRQEKQPVPAAHAECEPGPGKPLGQGPERAALDDADQRRGLVDVEDEVLSLREEATATSVELDFDVGEDV